MKKTHIKWVIAHEPIGLFLKVADQFADEVNEKTNGMFDIEVLSLSDYADKYNEGKKITKHDLIDLVNNGGIEMSHIYTNWLAEAFNDDLFALDLPYMIKDHDHADAILEGEIGKGMLATVADNSNVQPMAFTYSGGFRVVPANFAATDSNVWKGYNVRTALSPVSQAVFDKLGANTRPDIDLEVMNEYADRGEIDAGESTYVRILPLHQNDSFTHVNDTAHSLLITSIIVNQDFFATLPADVQKIMNEAAFKAARQERRNAVNDEPGIIEELKAQGVKIVHLTDGQKAEIAEKTAPIYEEFADMFTPGLVDAMHEAGKK